MTLDQIDRMVRQANPVPDLTALEPLDAPVLDEQRRTDMQAHDRVLVDDEGGEPKRGRNLLIGIAAAAAIIVGALLLLGPLTEDRPVADQPTTMSAVETATAFLNAYTTYDAATAATYLAPAALADVGGSLENLRLELAFYESHEFKWILEPCTEQNTNPSGTVVRCSYSAHGIRSDEIGRGPFGNNWFLVSVRDGKIGRILDQFSYSSNGFSDEMWEPFADWVTENYPDDVAVMYTDSFQETPQYTEESIALWEQRRP
ncbi:MAG: hypothetical protein ACRDVK_01165 [Acidimicrobiia bacterium]